MEDNKTDGKERVIRIDGCGEILRTRNQFNFSTEALAIDHANRRFALFNGMAITADRDRSSRATHRELRERLRQCLDLGYEEGDLPDGRYGQIDHRSYLPELRKCLAAEIKARAVGAVAEVDAEKTIEEAGKAREAERTPGRADPAGGMER